jgi:hypothetical protein
MCGRDVSKCSCDVSHTGGLRNGRRLIAFGGYAGRAGMLAGLRGLGERLINKGYVLLSVFHGQESQKPSHVMEF